MEEKKIFDFKSDEKFDLNSEYTSMFGTEEFIPKNPNESKLQDAENIINELGGKYIEGLSLQKYEEFYLNLNEFLKKFRTDSEEVKSMTKDDRDKLFGYGKEMFKIYQNKYGKLDFNFELSLEEWHYIYNTLTRKISYDGKEVFNYWELFNSFLEPTNEMVLKLPKELKSFVPICSIQSLILLSHLLMKWEEKGSTKSFYHFINILTEIAQMTKLFNAYGVIVERMTNRFNNWVNALNAMDGYNNDDRSGTGLNDK
jgi:hypothetical protein